ncbi:putative uncharacterized protein [Acidaminococcus sp. CAG:917]|nr:putative uncharacterized protein [Acidaminococcus sp. CAG:917]
MTYQIIDGSIEALWLILRIFLAGICGFVIGYERKTRSKEAGVRTHTIVAMGSALMMVVSKYAFADIADFDGARVAAQIVSGIGFLGAGIIIYRRDVLHGVTTAAGVWATAGIGMALGAGMYIIGICSTLLLVGFQLLLHVPFRILKGRVYSIMKAQIDIKGNDEIQKFKEIFEIKRFINYKEVASDGGFTANIEFSTLKSYCSEELHSIMSENSFIKSLEKFEEV